MANDTTVFLPKQQVRRGTAGYKATHGDKVVVVADDGSRRTAQEDAANDRKASRPKSAKAQEPASEKGAQG